MCKEHMPSPQTRVESTICNSLPEICFPAKLKMATSTTTLQNLWHDSYGANKIESIEIAGFCVKACLFSMVMHG